MAHGRVGETVQDLRQMCEDRFPVWDANERNYGTSVQECGNDGVRRGLSDGFGYIKDSLFLVVCSGRDISLWYFVKTVRGFVVFVYIVY